MIGIVVLAHDALARALVETAQHVFGSSPDALETVPVDDDCRSPEDILVRLRRTIAEADRGDGVLILTDMFGASHCTAANCLLDEAKVEIVSGVNVAMLIRALNYRDRELGELAGLVMHGGHDGIVSSREHRRKQGPDAA